MRPFSLTAGVVAVAAMVVAGCGAARASQMQEPRPISTKTDWPSLGKCEKKKFEWARVSLTLATDGSVQDVRVLDASRPSVEGIASDAVGSDRFAPANQDGRPLAVHGIMLVEMNTCESKVKQPNGQKREDIWLEEAPKQSFYSSSVLPAGAGAKGDLSGMYKIGGDVKAPVPIVQPVAELTSEARKENVQGEVMIRLVVDTNGMPQAMQVVKPLPAGLSDAAMAAVRKYRFRPATKDGKPVPVMVTIVVNFKQY
jgi:TonB family protein